MIPLGRIKSESELPNLATEKNTGCGAFAAPGPGVSGPDTRELDRQILAELRELLKVFPGADAKSLQQTRKWQTEWNSNLQYCSAC